MTQIENRLALLKQELDCPFWKPAKKILLLHSILEILGLIVDNDYPEEEQIAWLWAIIDEELGCPLWKPANKKLALDEMLDLLGLEYLD
jgi:hypothetical protein